MNKAYLLLGSNMGDRDAYLLQAANLIDSKAGLIHQKSKTYEADAWGHKEQDPFLNQVLCINTQLSPEVLLKSILEIELEMGRQRFDKWHQRIIDIDILFYGDQIVNQKDLNIPHPHICERRFTLVPLAELAPDLIHPECNKAITELLAECRDPLGVRVYVKQ